MNTQDLAGQSAFNREANSRFGLTGGIGSGKSTVAGLLADRGAYIVDADQIARAVLEPGTPGLAEVVETFGAQLLEADGTLNRAALAAEVFGNEDALAKLNGITHPRIVARTGELFGEAPAGSRIIHDIPLLVELGMQDAYDAVVVVDCPDEIRVARLVDRGLTEQDAWSRIAAQASREQRMAVADFVIDNSRDHGHLVDQVNLVWHEISE